MILRSSPSSGRALGKIICVSALFISACQSASPQPVAPPSASGTPLSEPTQVTHDEPAISEDMPVDPTTLPTPTTAPDVAPGTIIVNQTTVLDARQGEEVEILFGGLASQTIRLDATLTEGGADYELRLVDMFGNYVASIESNPSLMLHSIAEFTLPYSGTYRIVILTLDGVATLQIVVTTLSSSSGGGYLSGLGSAIDGRMGAERVYHMYQFPLTQGETVTIGARASVLGSPDLNLTLYGPDGRYITEVSDLAPPDNLDAILPGFVAPLSGTYTAIVTNYGGTFGEYEFSISQGTDPLPSEGEPDIVYDVSYWAQFYDQSNLRVTFDGNVGDVLRVEVTEVDKELDVGIYLYSPFDQVIAFAVNSEEQWGEDQVLSEMQLPYGGRYNLELRPVGSGQASFKIVHLTREDVTGGGRFDDEGGGSLYGSFLLPHVFHFYQFSANAGDRITLNVHSVSEAGQLDIAFAVIGPNGLQVAFADDSQGDNPADPALVAYQVTRTGVYTVVVYLLNEATGTYELELHRE